MRAATKDLFDQLERLHGAMETHLSPTSHAAQLSLYEWVTHPTHHFIADREPIDFSVWKYLRPIYEAVPKDCTDFDMTVQKPAQAGASIFALMWVFWLALRSKVTVGYFLPTATLSQYFSTNRFISLARQNPALHRLFGEELTPHTRRVIDEGSASVRRVAHSRVVFSYSTGVISTEALPLDAVVLDEVQEILLSDAQKINERLAASPLRATLRVSTPNFEGADINFYYQQSSQQEFVTRCQCADGVVLSDCWDPREGPLCIDRGNGTTPGVPTEPFYVCPKCRMRITDPQDGVFVARHPDVKALGFHWSQLLSPRQTPAGILHKWQTRVDTAHFFRRVLGLPFTDPTTLPVTQAVLEAAQNPALRWGPPGPDDVDGVFMGIDQMGADNRIVLVGRARGSGKMRLLHLEIVQSDDPFRRAAALMGLYRVRVCAVEALPNYNDAHRFAKEFPGRVFVCTYQDLVDELVVWGDRPRDKVTIRKTDEEAKLRWGVRCDQYKAMSFALGQWAAGAVETPDARTLVQPDVRMPDGLRTVAVCTEMFWLHLQRVALVTELPEGREDERRPRRRVKKVGIDPHFAYAWMLCCIAWIRIFGTEQMLTVETGGPSVYLGAPKKSAYLDQVKARLPSMFDDRDLPAAERNTCADCANFDATKGKGWCIARSFHVTPDMPSCDAFLAELGEPEEL